VRIAAQSQASEVIRADDGGWREINRGAVAHRRWPEKPARWR